MRENEENIKIQSKDDNPKRDEKAAMKGNDTFKQFE